MATATSSEPNDDISISNNPRGENPSQTLDPAIASVQSEKSSGNTISNSSSSGVPPAAGNPSLIDGVNSEELKGSAGKAAIEGDEVPVSDAQRKMRRAERFGITVQLSEEEKRNSRAERFGMGSTTNGSGAPKQSEEVKRKARAERFGLPANVATDDETKKKARVSRFASVSKPDPQEEEKRKARGIRFSNPTSNSLTVVNGKDNIESIADIAGKAGGGA